MASATASSATATARAVSEARAEVQGAALNLHVTIDDPSRLAFLAMMPFRHTQSLAKRQQWLSQAMVRSTVCGTVPDALRQHDELVAAAPPDALGGDLTADHLQSGQEPGTTVTAEGVELQQEGLEPQSGPRSTARRSSACCRLTSDSLDSVVDGLPNGVRPGSTVTAVKEPTGISWFPVANRLQ